MDHEEPSLTLAPLGPALGADPDDPETIRVRTVIQSRLLGVPLVPTRIGRFILIGRLGSGGMGTVYAAFDPQLDRKVAIKLLFRKHDHARDRERLVVEAKAMARLAHPNVVHVYEVGEHEGRLFLAMEYVRGPTLRAWLAERPRRLRETLAICVQAGHGLAAAHRAGIVHRDFKPDNVLVGDDARVVDFGVARSTELVTPDERMPGPAACHERTSTESGVVSGTPGYMSPEQLRGERADERSDASADRRARSASYFAGSSR